MFRFPYVFFLIVIIKALNSKGGGSGRDVVVPLILDTDMGVDDAEALLMLHRSAAVDLVGVTTVRGNVGSSFGVINAKTIANLTGKPLSRLIAGADVNLRGVAFVDPLHYQGCDGLGDFMKNRTLECEKAEEAARNATKAAEGYDPMKAAKSSEAAHFLVAMGRKFKGQLVVVAMGPLTNLAHALMIDPDFGKNLKLLSIMGGNTQGIGNTGINAEFNFWMDPLAAKYVLENINAPLVKIFGWELCESSSFEFSTWFADLRNLDTPIAAAILNFETEVSHNILHGRPALKLWADQVAASAAIWPEIVIEEQQFYATVETRGEFTTGMMVIDREKMLHRSPNVFVVLKADFGMVRRKILDAFKR